jgi:hypothetical protein
MRTREGNIPVLAHWDAPPKNQVRIYSPLEDRGFEPSISPRAGADLASDGVQLGGGEIRYSEERLHRKWDQRFESAFLQRESANPRSLARNGQLAVTAIGISMRPRTDRAGDASPVPSAPHSIVVYKGLMDGTPILNEIRKYERKLGFGWQIQLAKQIDISPQYMCDIISGRRGISEEIGAKFGHEKAWRKKK